MFTMRNAALNACLDNPVYTATARRHWTEQWWHDQVRRRPLPNRTEFINFSERDLINMTPVSVRLFFRQLTCSVMFFSFWKAFVKCSSLSVNGIDSVGQDFPLTPYSRLRWGRPLPIPLDRYATTRYALLVKKLWLRHWLCLEYCGFFHTVYIWGLWT